MGQTFHAQLEDLQISDRTIPPGRRLAECLGQFLPGDDSQTVELEAWLTAHAAAVGPARTEQAATLLASMTQHARDRVDDWLATIESEGALRHPDRQRCATMLLALLDGLCLDLLTPGSPTIVPLAHDILAEAIDGMVIRQQVGTRGRCRSAWPADRIGRPASWRSPARLWTPWLPESQFPLVDNSERPQVESTDLRRWDLRGQYRGFCSSWTRFVYRRAVRFPGRQGVSVNFLSFYYVAIKVNLSIRSGGSEWSNQDKGATLETNPTLVCGGQPGARAGRHRSGGRRGEAEHRRKERQHHHHRPHQ
ncbi:TetR family transcriptional regulator C-terminal domain-containing protein [Micromonospora peucetia]|uniref:TetR family transcriptional regulator C-terminal domain-containing protein n=1 Tax=Micromonospora peucetia TaxID=47871 RepID=UPI00114C9F52|nr:TetR family transcriptional regulator C-terminal domain-containing protein [Micromonospora peucetia]